MTEEEWMRCEDPSVMLHWLWPDNQYHAIERFYVACCQQIWTVIRDQRSRFFVEILESFVHGTATAKDLLAASEQAKTALQGGDKVCWIVHTATSTVWHPYFTGMLNKEKLIRHENQSKILRDIVPYRRPVTLDTKCLTPTVQSLALAIYNDRSFEKLPILADALEDSGCTQESVLQHLGSGGDHVRGCWALDLILGKS